MRPPLILLAALLFFCIIASASDIPLHKLEIDRYLPSNGYDYSFSFPIELSIIDSLLYIVDQKTGVINVFELNSLSLVQQFGNFGSEPGSFDRPISIGSGDPAHLVVSDFNNHRIQFLTPEGDYISELDFAYPWKFSPSKDELLYLGNFPGSAEAGIFAVTANELYQVIDLAGYFRKQKFGSVLDKYYSFCATDWGFAISFSGRDEVVLFHKNGKAQKNKAEKLPLAHPNTLYGKPIAYDDGFLLLGTSNNLAPEDSTQIKADYHNLIGKYNINGKLELLYRLPNLIFLTDSWALAGNRIYLYDTGKFRICSLIIY
jgi:hypothetical protein